MQEPAWSHEEAEAQELGTGVLRRLSEDGALSVYGAFECLDSAGQYVSYRVAMPASRFPEGSADSMCSLSTVLDSYVLLERFTEQHQWHPSLTVQRIAPQALIYRIGGYSMS